MDLQICNPRPQSNMICGYKSSEWHSKTSNTAMIMTIIILNSKKAHVWLAVL